MILTDQPASLDPDHPIRRERRGLWRSQVPPMDRPSNKEHLSRPNNRVAGEKLYGISAWLQRRPPHSVSNFSMTMVSAMPARVQSWKAGKDIIASMNWRAGGATSMA